MYHQIIGKKSSQQGFILAFSLVVILILTLLAIVTHIVSRSNIRVTGNYIHSVKAYAVADSAIAQAKLRLTQFIKAPGNTDFSQILNDSASPSPQCASQPPHPDYGFVLCDKTMPGIPTTSDPMLKYDVPVSNSGPPTYNVTEKYTLYIENNTPALDTSGTDAGDAVTDKDKIVILTAVANAGSAKTVIRAWIFGINGMTLPQALSAVGVNGADSNIEVKDFATVNGANNYNLPAAFTCTGVGCLGSIGAGSSPSSNAIATSHNIVGPVGSYNVSVSAPGAIIGGQTQAHAGTLTEGVVWENFVNQIIQSNVGNAMFTDFLDGTTNLGTRIAPAITVLSANTPGNTIQVTSGTTARGAGILIVTDPLLIGNLGDLYFEGIVIVAGNNGAFKTIGTGSGAGMPGNTHVFGGLVQIEEDTPDGVTQQEVSVGGYSNIKYSLAAITGSAQQALADEANGAKIIAWKEDYSGQ